MAYVSGFEHDVFVSYAHADNQAAGGGETRLGWVTTLRHNLIHAPGALHKDVYIDPQLKPGAPFDADVRRNVERSALLLIVLSQNYIKSEWCGKELDHFVQTHGDDPVRPRDVIVVELCPFVGFEGVPENIKNLRKEFIHAQFWYQTADAPFARLAGDPSPKEAGGAVYWLARDNLLHALDRRLKEIRRLGEMRTGQEARAPEESRHTVQCVPVPVELEGSAGVLLADVTDDLILQRKQVKIALEKEGIRVLPEGDYVGRSAAEFAAAFARDAQSSLLFVQLLSSTSGRIPKGEERPLPQLQFTAAQEAGLTILQWSAAVPESDVIADPAQHALFRTPFLYAVNLETFKDEVIERYRGLLSKKLTAPVPVVEAQLASRKYNLVQHPAQTLRRLLNREFDSPPQPPRITSDAPAAHGHSGIKRRLRLFLCHSSADKASVRARYTRLSNDGVDPWLDEEELLPGQRWQDEIPLAVKRSHVVLVCMSRASINKAGYVQKEIGIAT